MQKESDNALDALDFSEKKKKKKDEEEEDIFSALLSRAKTSVYKKINR